MVFGVFCGGGECFDKIHLYRLKLRIPRFSGFPFSAICQKLVSKKTCRKIVGTVNEGEDG
jgi:hypothetical protein